MTIKVHSLAQRSARIKWGCDAVHRKQGTAVISFHITDTSCDGVSPDELSGKRAVFAVKMFRKSLVSVGLRVRRPHHQGTQSVTVNYGDVCRRPASSSAASAAIVGGNVKLKTIDDLGGPSFLTTLNWLFVKGYFKTTQQLQVSEKRR